VDTAKTELWHSYRFKSLLRG